MAYRCFLLVGGACLAAGLAACAHGSGAPLSKGQPEAPPTLACLPEVAPGGPADTRRTHQGLLIAKEALDDGLPAPPSDRSYSAMQGWMKSEVAHWIAARAGAVSELKFQLGFDGGASASEQVVGKAAVGLLQEHTALDLQKIPPPAELAAEPEIAEMFQEVVAAQAEPFLGAALIAFRECADAAYEGPDATAHFAEFCDARFRRLRTEVEGRQHARLHPGAHIPAQP